LQASEIGHQIQLAIGVGLGLQASKPSTISTHAHPPSAAASGAPPKPNHPSNHVGQCQVSSINEPIDQAAGRHVIVVVVVAVRRRARRCWGPGNSVVTAAADADAGTVPAGRVRRRPRARAPASSRLRRAAPDDVVVVVRSARGGRVDGRRVRTGTATGAPHLHLHRGAAQMAP